jgi:transposase InsO family protein
VQQILKRSQESNQRSEQFLEKAEIMREDHPAMGCRKMALLLRDRGFGRDKVEALLLSGGFRISYLPNYTKTTRSLTLHRFRNLVEGITISGINKVVQTDITYLWVKNRFYYLVFIIDVYSRLIVGYHASCGMEAEANVKALQMMIALRGRENIKRLIHHSDRGTQYNSSVYLNLLGDCKIQVSMCKEAWENAYGERINRTIKEEYLKHRNIDSLESLRKEMDRAVRLYNEDRPHWSLPQQLSPAGYEKYVEKLPKTKRPKMTIYKHLKELCTK